MALVKRSESPIIYLEVKHYCLWRPVKDIEPAAEEITVNNPSTGKPVTKYGYRFDTVTGRAVDLVKYDTEKKYEKRYFGFKIHLLDGADRYVLDMPYQSQILRRFLRVARSINWNLPLSITIFKGKGTGDKKETGVWFRQAGDTIKPYYSKEQPHGCPNAIFDKDEQKWDFKDQHRWLVAKLVEETIPDIQEAAARVAPPTTSDLEHELANHEVPEPDPSEPPNQWGKDEITDDDVPF